MSPDFVLGLMLHQFDVSDNRQVPMDSEDGAILQMSPNQIVEARKRVAAFTPRKPGKDELPEPSWVQQIKLSGLSGPADRRLAIISGTTFSQGETASVKVAGKAVKLRCLEIRDKSALVEIVGLSKPRELTLADVKQ
jgi:hypothetical protein